MRFYYNRISTSDVPAPWNTNAFMSAAIINMTNGAS